MVTPASNSSAIVQFVDLVKAGTSSSTLPNPLPWDSVPDGVPEAVHGIRFPMECPKQCPQTFPDWVRVFHIGQVVGGVFPGAFAEVSTGVSRAPSGTFKIVRAHPEKHCGYLQKISGTILSGTSGKIADTIFG